MIRNILKKTQEVFFNPDVATDELVDEVFDIVNDRMKGIKAIETCQKCNQTQYAERIANIKCPTCYLGKTKIMLHLLMWLWR